MDNPWLWSLVCEFLGEWFYLRGFGLFLRPRISVVEFHCFGGCRLWRLRPQSNDNDKFILSRLRGLPVCCIRGQKCDACGSDSAIGIPTGTWSPPVRHEHDGVAGRAKSPQEARACFDGENLPNKLTALTESLKPNDKMNPAAEVGHNHEAIHHRDGLGRQKLPMSAACPSPQALAGAPGVEHSDAIVHRLCHTDFGLEQCDRPEYFCTKDWIVSRSRVSAAVMQKQSPPFGLAFAERLRVAPIWHFVTPLQVAGQCGEWGVQACSFPETQAHNHTKPHKKKEIDKNLCCGSAMIQASRKFLREPH